LERIVKALHECFDLSQVEEVTLEANPEDLTIDYLQGLKSLDFFNRLSIGIQSLNDSVLRLIGRRHTAAQAFAAVENAHAAGFSNLSVDFIYGLPDNSQFSIFNSQLVSHVSAYALTVEPGTALAVQVEQGRVTLPDEEEVVRQYHALRQMLLSAGFLQYEVSNYARPGFESRHNSRYWDRTPYLGLGPGAHSFSLFDGGSTSVAHVEKRRWNKPDGTFEEETLTEADAYNELLMTSLRTTRGLALAQVPNKYKERLHREMQPYVDCGWIVLNNGFYTPTEEGLLHADGIAAALFV
jgi:oxygen-independent coproporphyrinogen-3 oxidase